MPTSRYVEVRVSEVSGQGAFARVDIASGTTVLPLTGRIVHRAQIDENDYDRAILQIEENLFLEAEGGPDDYINHSCSPNLAFTENGKHFVAIRDIKAGDELTFDYATCEDDPDWQWPCLCASDQCRGILSGFPSLTLLQQQKIYPYCRPYLKRKYEHIMKKAA